MSATPDLISHRLQTLAQELPALREWLASSGATVTGPKREIYLDEGADGEAVTEIQYPIALREDTDA